MAGVGVTADLSNLGGYIGAVGGILTALESPAYKDRFQDYLMGRLKVKFMTDTIAVHRAGYKSLNHVFEWPSQDGSGVATGQTSDIPLFKLTKQGTRTQRVLSFEFLPSTETVPLPDPAKYGFNPEKLSHMNRHVFRYKALVMENDTMVSISPVHAKRLFIPDASNKYGYYMTSNTQRINPGGAVATGGFARWWNEWFTTKAQGIVDEEAVASEQHIASTGQDVIRYAAGTKIGGRSVGGQFAKAQEISVAYIKAKERAAELRFMEEIVQYYPEEEW